MDHRWEGLVQGCTGYRQSQGLEEVQGQTVRTCCSFGQSAPFLRQKEMEPFKGYWNGNGYGETRRKDRDDFVSLAQQYG